MNRCLLIVLLLTSASLKAADITLLVGQHINNDFEVAVNVAPTPANSSAPGSAIRLDNTTGWGLSLDVPFRGNDEQRIGAWYSEMRSEFGASAQLTNPDITVRHLHFTAMNYYPSGRWEPFVLAGFGIANFAPADGTLRSETYLSAQIGGGTNYRFSEQLLLRADARWVPTFFNVGGGFFCEGGCTIAFRSSTYNQFQLNLGLQYRF